MSSFITLEDINSCFMNAFDTGSIYQCNTADIGDNNAYSDIDYDFLEVTHTISGSNHTFSFKVKNVAWNGDYYFLDKNGDYIDSNATYDSQTGLLSITTTSDNVTLGLYLSYLKTRLDEFTITRLTVIPSSFQPMDLDDEENTYCFKSLKGLTNLDFVSNVTETVEHMGDGVYKVECYTTSSPEYLQIDVVDGNEAFKYAVYKRKPELSWIVDTTNIIPGVMNNIMFRVIEYSGNITNAHFYYDGNELPFTRSGTRFYVDLDLTEKKDTDDIVINMKLGETSDYCNQDIDYTFKCRNARVTSRDALEMELLRGTPFIEMGNDISLSNDISINHIVYLEGKSKTIDLNGHSIILNEESLLNVKNLSLHNGDKAIIQGKNSKLLLENCTFENNTTDNIGSCIYCKVDMDNVNENDDFTTSISGCTFINNNSCISHNGRLIITGSEYWNDDLDYVDKKFPAFLYQNNGEASIRNSIFDIDYTDDDFCSDEQSIGFAQSLIHCGEFAFINGANMQQLKEDNKLPFFEAPYNNRSHIFAKYYYPRIEACAYTSPELGFEDRSVCYSVSEDNWVYKQNAKVTRASTGDENTIRRITHV